MTSMLKTVPLSLSLLAMSACTASAQSQTQPSQSQPKVTRMSISQQRNSIHVSGSGEAKAPADEAFFDVAVETEGKTAKDAGEANKKRMTVLRSALLNAGLTNAEIETGSYNVYPVYGTETGPEPRKPTIKGYRATNQLTVHTLKLEQLGAFIDQALVAGANRVENVRFGLSKPEEAQGRALQDAVKRARQSAEVIAASLGVKLGEVLEASTVTDPVRPMPMMAFEARAKGMDSTPISPGEQIVTAQVQLRYAIGN